MAKARATKAPRDRAVKGGRKISGARKPARAKKAATLKPKSAKVKKSPKAVKKNKVARPRAAKKAIPADRPTKPQATGATPDAQGLHPIPQTIVRRATASSDRVPVMELHWGDPIPEATRVMGLIGRWVRRGDTLLRKLAEHGASAHETRADLRDGRFVWLAPDGRVSAEASAMVLCSWSKSTNVVAMGWADPLIRSASIARIDGMPAERDNVDEETAWRIAMEAAEAAGAEYLYRMPTPHASYFLALGRPTFDPERTSFSPSTPVGTVLKNLQETRSAIESRAEPAEVLRHRIEDVGNALLHEAAYTYRDSDWVSRLERTGRCLVSLSARLPRPSYGAIAAGIIVDEWLDRDSILELCQAITLLEDEWMMFS